MLLYFSSYVVVTYLLFYTKIMYKLEYVRFCLPLHKLKTKIQHLIRMQVNIDC